MLSVEKADLDQCFLVSSTQRLVKIYHMHWTLRFYLFTLPFRILAPKKNWQIQLHPWRHQSPHADQLEEPRQLKRRMTKQKILIRFVDIMTCIFWKKFGLCLSVETRAIKSLFTRVSIKAIWLPDICYVRISYPYSAECKLLQYKVFG